MWISDAFYAALVEPYRYVVLDLKIVRLRPSIAFHQEVWRGRY